MNGMGRLKISEGDTNWADFAVVEGGALTADINGRSFRFDLHTVAPPPPEYARALELLALVVDEYDQNVKAEGRDYEEMRSLVEGKGLLFAERAAQHEASHEGWEDEA